jgi:hypothetical protein
MRTLFLTAILSMITGISFAQNQSIEEVESETYNSFFNNDFKKVIETGNMALENGLDFYLLRYRLGIAYYVMKNYTNASLHLEKALSFDSNDFLLKEYLYYSFLNSQQEEKAYQLAETFSANLKELVEYKPKFFKSIALENGILNSDNFNQFKNADIKGEDNYGRGIFYSNVLFLNTLIVNQISANFKLYNNLSYVSNTSNEIYQSRYPVVRSETFTNKNNYFQLNTIASYFINDWYLKMGAGIYNSSYTLYYASGTFENTVLNQIKISITNYSGSLSISKRLKYFEPGIAISYTNLLNTNSLITEGFVTYYPLGNSNFYGNTKAALVSNENIDNTIYSQLFGFKLMRKTWLELFGAYGNHQNYITDNGLFVFNTPNQINWYLGTNLNLYFKKIDLTFGYGLQERESNYYNGNNPFALNSNNYTYNYNSLKTKITWKF